jgi:4-aminobutyrate aminotransferase-like enzyme
VHGSPVKASAGPCGFFNTFAKSATQENSRTGNVLRISPPLSIPAADFDPAVVILDSSLEESARK